MKVIVIEEENHGMIGIAKSYADAVHMLVNQDWLSELTEIYKEDFDKTVLLVEDLGEEWFAKLLEWSIKQFNECFDGCFYFTEEEVYEVAQSTSKAFSAARTTDARGIYHYTMSQHFCQGKVAKKLHKILSQNLCNLLLVFWKKIGYNKQCQEIKPKEKNFQKKLKKLLTN